MNARTPILLSGPPGVGKSTLSRALAARLGTTAIDLDVAIEQRTRRPPAAIIREDGEAAFRELEASTLESLSREYGVIALGGGTLTTARGRKAARALGSIVGLSADADVIRGRLASSGVDRPLLSNPDALKSLLAERARTYAAVDLAVDAAGAIEDVAQRVATAVRDRDVVLADVGGAHSRVLIGEHLAEAARGAVAALLPTRPIFALVDRGVPEALRERYLEEVQKVGPARVKLIPGGESVKTWAFLGACLEEALEAGAGRQSAVVGLGGGATCDLAALVASLLGRGAPVVLAPTTLLAQVDAAVGGKCAVNMNAGRNLVGAFHPATDVLVDVAMLPSLDEGERRSGLAELLKTAIIADEPLFDELARGDGTKVTASQVARAIRHKAAIVARDPYEHGDRKLLNLGHTLGHALESASHFELRHGEAVSIGTAAICRFGVRRGILSAEECERITSALTRLGLPTEADADLLERAVPYLGADKKADSEGAVLVLVHGVAKVSSKRVSSNELLELVRCGGKT